MSRGFRERDFVSWAELVIVGKRLKYGRFTQRNGPILRRVTKTAGAQRGAMSCHRGCRIIPTHPAVYCGHIRMAGTPTIALRDQVGPPAFGASAIFGRRLDPPFVQIAQSAGTGK